MNATTTTSKSDAQVAVIQMNSGAQICAANLVRRRGAFCAMQRRRGRARLALAVLPENFAFMGARDERQARTAPRLAAAGRSRSFSAGAAQRAGPVDRWRARFRSRPRRPTRSSPPAWCWTRRGRSRPLRQDPSVRRQRGHRALPRIGDHRRRRDQAGGGHHPAGRVGLSVCYDLRFPELCGHLRRKARKSSASLGVHPPHRRTH